MAPLTRLHRRALVAGLAAVVAVASAAAGGPPRTALRKAARIELNERFETHVIEVKFHDDLPVRLRDGAMRDLDGNGLGGAEAELRGLTGRWARAYPVAEATLTTLRATAQVSLERGVADLNTRYHYVLGPNEDAARVLDRLNALDAIELASPCPRPVPSPAPAPDFQANQGYENVPPSGIGAESVWNTLGVTGSGVRIVDLEYDWNLDHLDLPPVTVLGFDPINPFETNHHGTAVVGQLVALDNESGVTGIARDAEMYVAGVYNGSLWNVGGAIVTATAALGAGDVILIEQQTAGPLGEYVPVEWIPSVYDAIVTAVGNGIIVVEPAGNGNQNLDSSTYGTGNFGHYPFLPENDSGAIIVGAGAAPNGSTNDRSRLGFSTFGSTVDLQGWGEAVWTTGYGYAYSAEGVNQYYTGSFGGTSSASPIVAGACALVQSASIEANGAPMTPADVRDLLRSTGSPQTGGIYPVTQNIGPRPDALAAVASVLQTCEPEVDCNGNGVDDACDINAGTSDDCNGNGVPDDCDVTTLASDDCNANGTPDDCEVDAVFQAVSPQHAPIGSTSPLVFSIDDPAEARADVTVRVTASGDLDASFEVLHVRLNGQTMGSLFALAGTGCADPPNEDSLVIGASIFNGLIDGSASAEFRVEGSGGVDAGACGGDSYAILDVSYERIPANDVDGDGVPDDCTPPCPSDVDGNGNVGFNDLSTLLSSWGDCVGCPADVDGDGSVAFADLSAMLAAWGPC